MIVSPGSSRPASSVTVDSVGAPAGTMIHTARGLARPATSAASESLPLAPSAASAFTLSGLRS